MIFVQEIGAVEFSFLKVVECKLKAVCGGFYTSSTLLFLMRYKLVSSGALICVAMVKGKERPSRQALLSNAKL